MTTTVCRTDTQKTVEKPSAAKRRVVVPEYRVNRNDQGFVLTAWMPGVTREQLSVQVEGARLVLKGTSSPPKLEGFSRLHNEFSFADYEVSFKLAPDIDTEAISAVMKQGVVALTLPVAAAAKARSIEVSVG